MNLTDVMLYGEAMTGGGGERKELELYRSPYEVLIDTAIGTELGGEYEDKLGKFTVVSVNYTPNVNYTAGYFRLKKGVRTMPKITADFGSSFDLTNYESGLSAVGIDGTLASPMISNSASRVILPEVYPNTVLPGGSLREASIPILTSQPPVSIYLPKHTANDASASDWIGGTVNANVAENIVIAPKGMDAPLHLHAFTKMTAETIVAILENLADVSGRGKSYTLTLGDRKSVV